MSENVKYRIGFFVAVTILCGREGRRRDVLERGDIHISAPYHKFARRRANVTNRPSRTYFGFVILVFI